MRNHSEFHTDTAEHIREYGRSIISVFDGEGDEIPFAYTIGNTERGLPELLVIGTTKAYFLNNLSQLMIDRGSPFKDGELVDLGGKYPVRISLTNDGRAQDDYTIQAGQYYGTEEYPVLQVLLCDKEGRFPGEAECQRPYCDVPILRKRLL
jgi:hypothetical protein